MLSPFHPQPPPDSVQRSSQSFGLFLRSEDKFKGFHRL
jgi:hypothetical protein